MIFKHQQGVQLCYFKERSNNLWSGFNHFYIHSIRKTKYPGRWSKNIAVLQYLQILLNSNFFIYIYAPAGSIFKYILFYLETFKEINRFGFISINIGQYLFYLTLGHKQCGWIQHLLQFYRINCLWIRDNIITVKLIFL